MTLSDEMKSDVIQWLKDSMQLEVETKSVYTGGFNGRDLYENSHTLKLTLDGQLITEVYL